MYKMLDLYSICRFKCRFSNLELLKNQHKSYEVILLDTATMASEGMNK